MPLYIHFLSLSPLSSFLSRSFHGNIPSPLLPPGHSIGRTQFNGPHRLRPKLYIDLPLKTDLPAATSAFNSLPRQSGTIPISDFNQFLKQFFDEAGSDMVYAKPVDFKSETEGFLVKVENEGMRGWALEVHAIWKILLRRVSDEVKSRPERHTLLYLPGTARVTISRGLLLGLLLGYQGFVGKQNV